jgi:hypothetical protein
MAVGATMRNVAGAGCVGVEEKDEEEDSQHADLFESNIHGVSDRRCGVRDRDVVLKKNGHGVRE